MVNKLRTAIIEEVSTWIKSVVPQLRTKTGTVRFDSEHGDTGPDRKNKRSFRERAKRVHDEYRDYGQMFAELWLPRPSCSYRDGTLHFPMRHFLLGSHEWEKRSEFLQRVVANTDFFPRGTTTSIFLGNGTTMFLLARELLKEMHRHPDGLKLHIDTSNLEILGLFYYALPHASESRFRFLGNLIDMDAGCGIDKMTDGSPGAIDTSFMSPHAIGTGGELYTTSGNTLVTTQAQVKAAKKRVVIVAESSKFGAHIADGGNIDLIGPESGLPDNIEIVLVTDRTPPPLPERIKVTKL